MFGRVSPFILFTWTLTLSLSPLVRGFVRGDNELCVKLIFKYKNAHKGRIFRVLALVLAFLFVISIVFFAVVKRTW